MNRSNNFYMPNDTNLLVDLYQGLRHKQPLVLQRHLWDFKSRKVRDDRAAELLTLCFEVLMESKDESK